MQRDMVLSTACLRGVGSAVHDQPFTREIPELTICPIMILTEAMLTFQPSILEPLQESFHFLDLQLRALGDVRVLAVADSGTPHLAQTHHTVAVVVRG